VESVSHTLLEFNIFTINKFTTVNKKERAIITIPVYSTHPYGPIAKSFIVCFRGFLVRFQAIATASVAIMIMGAIKQAGTARFEKILSKLRLFIK